MNPTAVRGVFDLLDPPVWLVTAAAGGKAGGLIATGVMEASIVPAMPRVLACLARQHHTWGLVEEAGTFALHLLGEEHLEWVWRFGLRSGRDLDKVGGLAWRAGPGGAPLLEGARAWLDCRVESRMDTGDRTVYLAEVLDGAAAGAGPVLTVKRALALAPPDRLRQLKENLEADARVDAGAIEAWRRARTTG
jgi:flavin reductase (DIM6/NTAB) family NADH-FMN oxidoreductase RutF